MTSPAPDRPAWWASWPGLSDGQSRAAGLALEAYQFEVRFYREVADRVTARLPTLYLAEVEPETGWFTLILGNLASERRPRTAGSTAGGEDVAAAVLEEMAGLRAPCSEAADLAALSWLNRNTPQPWTPCWRRW